MVVLATSAVLLLLQILNNGRSYIGTRYSQEDLLEWFYQ